MKKYLFLISIIPLILFFSTVRPAQAAPAVVQTCAANTFGTSVTCSTSANVTAGDVIQVIGYTESGTTAPTFSGTASCNITWTTLQSNAAQSYSSAYGTVASTGACSITMTTGDAAKSIYVDAVEMSGVSAVIDGDAVATTASNTSSYTTPSITTTADGDMVIGLWIVNKSNGAGTVTVNSPFTCAASPSLCGATNVNGGVAFAVQSTHGAIAATFNQTGSVFGSFLETTAYQPSTTSTNPPVISNVASSGLTSSAATITWTTDISSDSQVDYGTTTSYGSSSALNSSLVINHSVSLSGLTASTLYHYRVKSSSNGNLAISADNTFTTLATPPADTTAPTVPSGLTATAVSSSVINLSWTASTDVDNTANQISYTIYRGGVQIGTTAAGTTSYSDSGLTASTAYSYTVDAFDTAGNHSAQSTSASATTQASSPPPSGNQLWSNVLASSRAVDWSHAGAGGLDGALPSVNWTQCGATIAPYGDAGIADISGNTLTWRAGTAFGSTAPSWVGGTIKVGGVSYTIASVDSPTSITLTTSSPIPLTGRGFVGPNLGNVSTINNQLNGCAPDTYVQLGTGYFGLNGGISDTAHNNVEVRGMGADKTQLIFSNLAGCLGAGAGVCFDSSDLNYNAKVSNLANWTAGYAPGTTNITLDSTPFLKVGNPIILDQVDDSIASDTGAVFVCQTQGSCSISGNGNAPRPNRDQMQIVTVTSCNGVTTQGAACTGTNVSVGISPGLYMPNWRSSQQPQAWWATGPVLNVGVQNLSIDTSALGPSSHGITFFNTLNGWVRGVRSIDGGYAHVFIELSARITVRDSYFYLTQNSVNSSYGISCFGASDNLYENNILHAISGPIIIDSSCSGSVIGYNYSINDFNSLGAGTWINAFSNPHTAGVDTLLYEGNIGPQIYADNFHGTRNLITIFRNYLWGTQPVCWGGSWTGGVSGSGFYYPEDNTSAPCTNPLMPVILRSYSRFFNVIGNVLGTPGVQSSYQGTYSTISVIYDIGAIDPQMGGGTDPNTAVTLMRWGNYDTVNRAARFLASEVPSNLTGVQAPFSNPVPATNILPPSFYETSKPFWWPASTPWPPVGPDVAGGNILQCTSGPYIRGYALAAAQCGGGTSAPIGNGLAYAIPAMNCYLNVMGGTPDGTGHYLSFNADNCYGTASTGGTGADLTPPTVPTNVSATAVSSSAINVSWTASTDTDNTASQLTYTIYRNGTQIGTTASGVTSYSDTGLTAGTTYTYTVSASDPAGNSSSQSSPAASATTQSAPDTTAPTVSITSPANNASVSATITVSAAASDPTVSGQTTSGLSLVTVSIDGTVFATSTSGSLSKSLDTTTLTNSSHTITAIAKDNAGNTSPVATVTITVNNATATKYPRLVTLTSLEGLSAIPSNTTITATVLSPASGATLETQSSLTANASKQYTVSFLSSDPQLVNIRIKVNGYLSQLLTNIDTTVNSSVALSVPQLLAGDSNNDNTINSLDYSLLNSNYNQTFALADFNGDGLVNSLDYAILKNNYGKAGQ